MTIAKRLMSAVAVQQLDATRYPYLVTVCDFSLFTPFATESEADIWLAEFRKLVEVGAFSAVISTLNWQIKSQQPAGLGYALDTQPIVDMEGQDVDLD